MTNSTFCLYHPTWNLYNQLQRMRYEAQLMKLCISWRFWLSQFGHLRHAYFIIMCLGFWGVVWKGTRVERPKRSIPWRLPGWPFNRKVLHNGSGTICPVQIFLKSCFFIGHKLKTEKQYTQGKAVINFLDSILDKSLRSTVALLAARGRGNQLPLVLLLLEPSQLGKV